MKKVFCFGEILLRMSPVLDQAWINNASMPVHIGGAELNVAKALAGWQQPVTYMSAMPDNYLSKEITASIAACNIGVEAMQFCGDRMGIYFLPQGADLKNAGVIYDRAHASFSTALFPGKINWDTLLEGSDWFHFSAISPALNEQAAAVCLDALKAAKRLGLTISVDLNYRAKLWKYGKQPAEVMPELVSYADLIMGNIWSARDLMGIDVPKGAATAVTKEAFAACAKETAAVLLTQNPSCKIVANTFRFTPDGAGVNYYATLDTISELIW
jgi:2-dehydro-3-deoxygluconokinase